MTEKHPVAGDSDDNSDEKHAGSRTPRSIRFFDSEWNCIEKEAADRGMTAAELVRYAAVSLSTGRLTAGSQAFPPEIRAQIERIYRGVYLVSSLKRDEMLRDGKEEEFERIRKEAHDSQDSITENASG